MCLLYCVDGRVDRAMYCQVLSENLLPSTRSLIMGGGWVFQQDNDQRNTNKSTKELLKKKHIKVMDEDKIKKILYSITGPGATEDPVGLFAMDKDTGDLYVNQRLDREKQAHYLLALADVEDPMEIIINVIDMNDNKPIFEQKSYVAEVAESSPKGTTVIQVKATDADEPGNDNSIIKYTILSQEPKLPSDSMFAINSFNGAIMVEGVGLDREVMILK
uniref:Cadherin domain-containing protein n=1 Tax=Oryzias sinensis TaxID=183150 RepID=A0A8C7XFN5_9TELE